MRDDLKSRITTLKNENNTTLDDVRAYGESDYEIEEIEGIGKGYGKQLRAIGINRTGDLIDKCSSPEDIRPIAETMKLEDWVIRSWTSMADLCRVKGIGGQFAELLDFSGIHSVQQLATANAAGLLAKMKETNDKELRVEKLPDIDMVRTWIEYSRDLEPRMQIT